MRYDDCFCAISSRELSVCAIFYAFSNYVWVKYMDIAYYDINLETLLTLSG